jgi:multiple sugar transport system substrate-binding protein
MAPFIQKSVANFQSKYPNIKVSWEDLVANYYDKIDAMAAGGTLPDVVNLRSFDMYDWYRKKALYDVTDQMKADGLTADNYVATVGSCLQAGRYWGLPYDASVDIIFYNKDLFDKAGIGYPAKDWTWDKVLDAAKALTQKSGSDTSQYGFASMPPISDWQGEAFLLQNGARFVSDDRTKFLPDLPPVIDTLKWWTGLVTQFHVAPTPAANSSVDLFSIGKGGMAILGQWQIPSYRQGLKFKWDVAWLPAGPKGQNLETQGGTYIIYGKTKAPEAAWPMLKWITSETDWQANVYGASGYSVPAWKEADDSFVAPTKAPQNLPPTNAQVVLDELASASTGELWPNYWQALKAWTDQISLVLLGKATPEQAAQAAQTNANKIISDALASG